MLHRVCTADPITGTELRDLDRRPSIHVESPEDELTIYFESDDTRRAFLDIPVEHPIQELSVNLDNPTDECIDEG